MLLLLTVFSCTDDLNETLETTENPQLTNETTSLVLTSLNEINDQVLKEQLPESKKHLKDIINSDYNYLLAEHNLNGLFLDNDDVVIKNESDQISYTFLVVIPHVSKDEELNQYGYLTLNFNDAVNTGNQLVFGFLMDQYLSFDKEGNILSKDASNPQSEYTPKPSNLPSKAPKSVICRYKSHLGINASSLVGYCDGYTGYGGTVPAPQYILDALFAPQLTHNYTNLYFLNSYYPNGQQSFNSYYSYYFPQIKSEIINYYQKAISYGYTYSTTSNRTQAVHVNKQAFVDSFFNWLTTMQSNAPNTYTYLINNKPVMYQLFNFFADYNAKYDEFGGIYLGLQWGGYSSNPDIKCITLASYSLLTSSGLTLLQQLGSGSITIEQFRSSLTSCN